MKNIISELIIKLLVSNPILKKIALLVYPIKIQKKLMQKTFLKDYIYSYYPIESIKEKKFYNIGAGNQRSKHNIWSYIDMPNSNYNKKGVDIFYNLESLEPIPIPDNFAEIVFNSFVIEHISINATKNLCNEAYRILKKGGIFHSKIHCYEYAYKLLKNKIISPSIPFDCRESNEVINNFIKHNKGKVIAYFDQNKNYVIKSINNESSTLTFSHNTAFLYHNATAAIENILKKTNNIEDLISSIPDNNLDVFYESLKNNYVDVSKKQPHQHNADYISKEELFNYIKSLGFSEVYFTQPYQSVSPALWEENLNPINKGFLFSIEAIK